ncbi:MAG TPA: histidine phosphatase family protein [Rhizomicrobium sp.]|jgi:phosphohistidine phosphatase|nr:histidine phosphatase family protein [Rhizomicrobium sp.]
MKRLLLLRHGKAEGAASDDRKRALIARGKTDSARIGRFLREDAYVPDAIFCSDSTRTRQTLEAMLPELQAKPELKYLSELYLAEPELIFSLVRKVSDRLHSLMIIGHNPGLEQCALALAAVPLEKKLRKRYDVMDEKFPTCSVAVIDFEIDRWRDVTPGRGELDAFVRPKDLEEN